jgi:hypothetical protein
LCDHIFSNFYHVFPASRTEADGRRRSSTGTSGSIYEPIFNRYAFFFET